MLDHNNASKLKSNVLDRLHLETKFQLKRKIKPKLFVCVHVRMHARLALHAQVVLGYWNNGWLSTRVKG
jgi:hypothetical protein